MPASEKGMDLSGKPKKSPFKIAENKAPDLSRNMSPKNDITFNNQDPVFFDNSSAYQIQESKLQLEHYD